MTTGSEERLTWRDDLESLISKMHEENKILSKIQETLQSGKVSEPEAEADPPEDHSQITKDEENIQ